MPNTGHIPEWLRGRAYEAHDNGLSHRAIADKLKISKSTSSRVVTDYDQHKKTKPGVSPGRPCMHSPTTRHQILTDIDTNRLASVDTFAKKYHTSLNTIIRLARDDGFERFVRRVVPEHDEKCIAQRLSWAHARLPGSRLADADVIYSDEKPLQVGRKGRQEHCFRREGEALRPDLTIPRKRRGKTLMVWACIGAFVDCIHYNHKLKLL
jgi:hypothetical protein